MTSLRYHAYFWMAVTIFMALFVYVFKGILLPFVLGIALAYFLDPLVKFVMKAGMNRAISGLVILAAFCSFALIVFGIILPIIYRELVEFSQNVPDYIEALSTWAAPHIKSAQSLIGQKDGFDLAAVINGNTQAGLNVLEQLLSGVASGGKAVVNLLSFVMLTPIVAYFMIKEWDTIKNWITGLMPEKQKHTILQLLGEIDKKLSGFVRGQLTVAFVLGIGYAVALSIAGLKYGFLIGISAGVLSIIPMLGSIFGLLCGVLVAWFQTGEWTFVLLIAAIFLIGQFIEGNFITPRLIGKSVGLHPLWIFFALMAGGSLLGILGMLLAVPIAAVVGVLASFAIGQYKKSPYYKRSAPSKDSKNKKRSKTQS